MDELFMRNLRKASKGLSILYAEDDFRFRTMVEKHILQPLGLETLDLTSDGNGALLQYLKQDGSYHLVITDFDMPGMTGGELIHRIHEQNSLNK